MVAYLKHLELLALKKRKRAAKRQKINLKAKKAKAQSTKELIQSESSSGEESSSGDESASGEEEEEERSSKRRRKFKVGGNYHRHQR